MTNDDLLYRELCQSVIGVFYQVFNELGSGFLEAAYRKAMHIALEQSGIACRSEVPASVVFRGHIVGDYRMDLVVNDLIVIECKAVEKIAPVHIAQLINYLRATDYPIGFVLNFGPTPTFKRVVLESRRRGQLLLKRH